MAALPQEQLPETNTPSLLSNILSIWLQCLPEGPIRSRDLLNYAIEESPALLRALDAALPGFASHPHPPRLVAWLKEVENLPVKVGDFRYRLTRDGHRWKILKISLTLALT